MFKRLELEHFTVFEHANFISLYDKYDLAFDEVYYDVIKQAYLPSQRNNDEKQQIHAGLRNKLWQHAWVAGPKRGWHKPFDVHALNVSQWNRLLTQCPITRISDVSASSVATGENG